MKIPREQILKSLREYTPDEERIVLAIEAKLDKVSGWPLRDAIKEWHKDAQGMVLDVGEALENEEWLRAAWELVDVVNAVDTLCAEFSRRGFDLRQWRKKQ